MTRRYLVALVDGGGNIPPERDQADTAARVTARRAGIALKRSARPLAIADAVRRILHRDSYRIAARQLGAVVRRDVSTDALVRELELIPETRATAHGLTARVDLAPSRSSLE